MTTESVEYTLPEGVIFEGQHHTLYQKDIDAAKDEIANNCSLAKLEPIIELISEAYIYLNGPCSSFGAKHIAIVDQHIKTLFYGAIERFTESKDDALLLLFVKHNIAPVSKNKLDSLLKQEVKSKEDIENNQAASVLQNHIMSYNRYLTHLETFKVEPCRSTIVVPSMIASNNTILDIIEELVEEMAIIPPFVHHITTKNNLDNIIFNEAFYGGKILKNQNIHYQEGLLTIGDSKRSYANVVCFAPFAVDNLAFAKSDNDLKSSAVKVTIDIRKLENKSLYQHFFCIKDKNSPHFDKTVHINQWLSAKVVSTENDYFLTFIVDGKEESVNINENFFYGDIKEFNRYCAFLLFDLIGQSKVISDAFHRKISACSKQEVKK